MVRRLWIIPIDEGFNIERGSYKMGNFMAPKKLSISDIHQFAMCGHVCFIIIKPSLKQTLANWSPTTVITHSISQSGRCNKPFYECERSSPYNLPWIYVTSVRWLCTDDYQRHKYMQTILYCNVKYTLQVRRRSPVSTEISIVEELDSFTSHTVSASLSNLLIVWLYILRSCENEIINTMEFYRTPWYNTQGV